MLNFHFCLVLTSESILEANPERLSKCRNVWPTIEPITIWRSPPLGMEGGTSIGGMGGGNLGERRPDHFSKTAERRRWRAGCLQTGALTAPRWAIAGRMGIRVAVSVTVRQRDSTQRHIVRHLLPAQGLGVPCAPGINDRRVTHNMCCVMSRKHSCMPTSPRSSRYFVGASGLVALPVLASRRISGAE